MGENKEFELSKNFKKYIPDRINYSLEIMLNEKNKTILGTNNRLIPTFWDTLNGEIIKYSVNDTSISVFIAKRGKWEFILIFDNNTQILYSLMKETNFKILQKNVSKRLAPHYGDILARTFNKNLKDLGQVKFDAYSQSEPNTFSDDKINFAVDNILVNLNQPKSVIKNHAFILFDTAKSEIVKIRCVLINNNFDVCFEENWNNYIIANYNMVTETIISSDIIINNPTKGLAFTQKSKDKIEQKNNIELKKSQNAKES